MNWLKKLFKKKEDYSITKDHDKFLNNERNKQELPPPIPKEELISISFVGPDGKKVDMTEENQKELNEAVAELQKLFSDGDYTSLEDFMNKHSSYKTVPFQTANGLPDGFHQVNEEMGNHKEDTQDWSDEDFLEHLMAYYNQGYEFEGLEEMFNRYQNTKELTKTDQEKVRRWYFLAAQEMVYDV